jgi:hypothetical protein
MYGRSALGSTTQQESSINAGGINERNHRSDLDGRTG